MKSEYEDDIVFARFLNFMNVALLHKKIDYLRHEKHITERENTLNEMEWELLPDDDNNFYSFFSFLEARDIIESEKFKNAYEKLTRKQQIVLQLYYERKFTNKKIALKMNVSEKAVEQLKVRALKKLKNMMEE